MPPQFTTTRRVEFCETDMGGIAHFTNYYRWMEQAEHEFFRTLGLEIVNHQPDGSIISWPRVAASCSFKAPARYNDVIEIRLNITRKSAKSLTFNIEFWRDETQLAVGEVTTVCCQFRAGEDIKSVAIPPEYNKKLQEASTE